MKIDLDLEIDPARLAELSVELEASRAADAITWAVGCFGSAVGLASSFQNCVLIDMAVGVDPDIEVVFLDTGYHFPETLDFVELVRARYDLNLSVARPALDAATWPCGSARCCELRKVLPLDAALEGHRAWISGLKRVDTVTRALAPVVGWDEQRAMVKVNPLAKWSDDDVARYTTAHRLPIHPLVQHGYPSIGCAPTTVAVAPGEDRRAGRWPGSTKIECGLHE